MRSTGKIGFVTSIFLSFLLNAPAQATSPNVVINELMYHPLQPAYGAEPLGEEFIELFNRGGNAVSLNGWRFDKGVSFTFSNVTLAANGYLVVVANRSVFSAKHPGVTNFVGDWVGTLGNNGETVRLVDAGGNTVDSVSYGTEGDWATRQRSPSDLGQRGWIWNCPADGLGNSIELRNPFLGDNRGQNWAPSSSSGGTPGRVNSRFTNNVAPLILDAIHSPLVPKSTDPVAITARIVDESPAGLSVLVFWRVDANPQTSPFSTTTMFDDGAHGDGAAGDGIYGAVLPAQPNNTVVEFYVQAIDAGGRVNTWPQPAIAATDGAGPAGQVANALYQVDDNAQNTFGVVSSSQPVYKLIMTEAERAQLAAIPCSSAQNSDAEMNGTFIAVDGVGVECRYRCGFRNRGHGSRCATPPNYRVNIPNDQRWKGVRALNINTVNTPAQILGAIIAQKAGVAGANSHAAQVRVNNLNRASTGNSMLGAYAANEVLNSDWADEHFPLDSAGNIYRAIRDIAPPDWVWRGSNVSAYVNTYFKGDNSSAYDWSDLIQLHRIVGTNDLFTTANVRQVANVEQWCLYYSVMSLFGNNETSANTGYNDDYYMYRGVNDPRFILMYYDNDTVLSSLFGARSTSDGLFSAEADHGMGVMNTRFLEWPDFKPIYYATLQRLLDTTFSATEFNALVDEAMSVYPAGSAVTTVANSFKSYMNSRRSTVQSLINGHVPPVTNNPIATVSGEPRSPTPFTTATLAVGGSGITYYKFRLNSGAYSAETPVGTPIRLSGLADNSTNTVYVVGRNSAGIYQADSTVSKTWVVNTAWPAVRLNEVLAHNVTAVNHAGTFPDMVELYNEGAAPVDLSGLRLSDDPAAPDKFSFPPGTSLGAGNYLVVYANNDDGTPGLHLGFALSQDGEGVYLYDKVSNGGALLDSVVFGPQVADLSIGRFSSGDWLLCQPTFGTNNAAQALGVATGLRINEWLASGTLPFVNDFLELYNPDPLPVALGGLYLTDQPIGAPGLHRIADNSFIAGSGFAVFIADGDPEAGPNHVNFALSADLGAIGLSSPTLSPIDSITYPPQVTGVAQGRCPDGGYSIVALSFPTPGSPNACPTTPAALPVATLLPMNALWRYDASGSDLGTAWRETGYNDSAWSQGRGVLGYDNGNNPFIQGLTNTALPATTPTTTYFRTHFQFTNTSVTTLIFTNCMDDGVIVYINGHEVYRWNMPSGTVTFSTSAAANVETTEFTEIPVSFESSFIQAGDNVLAVELHQVITADSNMGLGVGAILPATSAALAGVVINEVLANNATLADPDGSTPDWIELYNPSTNAVDLGNMSLSDSTLNPRRWVFPAPTLLPAQGYRVIRCDSGAPASATNTGFGLSATGDSVYLFNADLTVRDWIAFGLQAADFSLGRVPVSGGNWALTLPSPGVANTAALLGDPLHLKINEWMATPSTGDDWFELYNPDAQPVALGGLGLSDDLTSSTTRMNTRIPALSFIGALTNGYQRFHADKNLTAGADHVDFKLDGTSGESIGISTAEGTLIHGIHFGPQQIDVSEGFLPDGSTNLVRFTGTASPGNGNYLLLTNVVISEVLAHTDLPLEDAIELQNVSGSPINIGGWYLSDSKNNLRKYLIPDGTTVLPGGFVVFYEYQFNSLDTPALAFALSSAKGDQVYLSEADGSQLTGYRAEVKFGASQNGVSFGRYVNSVGDEQFVSMSARTFGADNAATVEQFRTGTGLPNAYPLVGPVVISEIMYHPPNIGTNDNVRDEFIELHNISNAPVALYDVAYPTNTWRLGDAVDFEFPPGIVLPGGGELVIVSFDPVGDPITLNTFRTNYNVHPGTVILGPYRGKLANSSAKVELWEPDTPNPPNGSDPGFVPYVLVERIHYSDSAPWPLAADGQGQSLQRLNLAEFGNDPANWVAATPTPGPQGLALDSDNDGMPDAWELQYFSTLARDGTGDYDHDGISDFNEYLGGSDPTNPLSVPIFTAAFNGSTCTLTFTVAASRSYSVQYKNALTDPTWTRLADVTPQASAGTVQVTDNSAGTVRTRFYRLVSPAQP